MHLDRLGGFRNMQIISPLLLYSYGVDLQQIYNRLETTKDRFPDEMLLVGEDCTAIIPILQSMLSELNKVNCPVTASSAEKPLNLMKDGRLTYGNLKYLLGEMDGRLRDEIKLTYAFSLTHQEANLWDPKAPLLGRAVADKFETAAFDIEEAGKCHALGRSTAAVFHCFRVLELGVKAVAKALQVSGLDKPVMKNWGNILTAIENEIKLRWPKETDRDSGDGELFWGIYTLMLAIKTPRNGTMHPARKYTEQEADSILRIVGDIMMRLATRIDESGRPKVARPRRKMGQESVSLVKA